MKILVLANLYYPYVIGGGEISTKILCEGLVKAGHKVKVLTSGEIKSDEIIEGVDVSRFPTNIYWSYNKDKQNSLLKGIWHVINEYNVRARRFLRAELQRNHYDLMLSSTLDGFSGLVWKEASKHGLKVAHILRSYSLACPRAGMYKKKHSCQSQCIECKLLTQMKKLHSNRYVNTVFGISQFILEKHLNLGYFQKSNHIVVSNPVCDVQPNLKMKEGDKICIGFVGSIQEKKGVEVLISEFTKIHNENIVLKIYGRAIDDDYLSYLKDRFLDDRILYCGYKKESEIYESLDILVVPSLWQEPFGRIIIEAYSYGIPVVGSNFGGIPELIVSQRTGLIFDVNVENSLKKSIEWLVQNDRFLELRCNCLEYSKHFLRDTIIKYYEECFINMLKQ